MQLTKNQKIGIGIGAVLVTGAIIYLIVKPKKDSSGAIEDPTGNNGSTSNQLPFDALHIANTLHDAMKDTGTDESAIFTALQGINALQFAQIVKAFGSRTYNTYTGNDWGYNVYPLKVWLSEELSDAEYKTLRSKYPNSL